MGKKRTTGSFIGVIALAVTLGVTGCAAATPTGGSATAASSKYGLPSDVKTVTIATSVGTAPYEYYKTGGSDVLGYEPDLLNEAASRLGVKINWNAMDFGAMFSALNAGRTDLIANGLIDRRSRQKQFDMLDYVGDASGILGLKGTTTSIKSLDDLCGHSLATAAGTTWETFFSSLSDKCVSNGHPKIQLTLVKDAAASVLAVTSGRAEYAANQQPLLAFAAKQTAGLEVAPLTYLKGLVAIAFPKDSPLTAPMQKVLDEMIADGTYGKILEKWGMGPLAIAHTSMNAGTTE